MSMPLKTAPKALKSPSKTGSRPEKKKPSKPVSSRQISEHEIHLKAWQWVQKTYPSLLIFHVPNGENRNVATAVKLKRMGVLPGVADFLIFFHGVCVAIELKDGGGKQSAAQEKFQARWTGLGHWYEIARSLEDFQRIVQSYYGVAPWAIQSAPKLHLT